MPLEMPLATQRSTRRPGAAVRAALTLAVCLAIPLLPTSAAAQRRIEIYKAKHRTAEELVPLAQAVMADDGGVEVDARTNSLVLIGEGAAVSEALAVLSSRDRVLRSILLRYDTRRVRELARQGFDVRWTAATGDYRLGNVRVDPDSDASVRARARGALQRLAESFGGVLRMGEGEATHIETGTMVPYTTRGPSGPNTGFVDATTGLEARPRILADGRVQVDLAAFARELRPDLRLDSMGASTLVTLKPGALVVVGSSNRMGSGSRSDPFEGARSERGDDEAVLLLRVDVE